MSQHAQRTRPALTLGTLPPNLSMVAAGAAVLGVLGVGLGAFAWTGSSIDPVTGESPSGQQVTFSYTAEVPRTAAYDDTTVRSPDPVFRTLADTVDIDYSYEGEPGSVSVVADLSTASGWHSIVPLTTEPISFDADSYQGTVSLDLPALERRAQQAAEVIGVPADQLAVTVRPEFVSDSGAKFEAGLPLTLSSTHLALADASALTVTDSGTVQTTTTEPRTLGLLGREISVATARTVAIVMLILGLLLAAGVVALARATAPVSEAAAIRRRHANLLVRVEPMPAPTGRPVIDVTEFSTLVKLAERYGLLVLHWTRSDVETFVVQDESATYRYRAAGEPTSGSADELTPGIDRRDDAPLSGPASHDRP